ncbi:hypothetical protein [Caldimonas manganoxidans]|jgi:hypothetical protein|uniref:hypothetical protein n=1 Tax=Caldimonas manganoxidans TaxID=196015 RepID=UPI000376B406|nr:hypothetical protein [Caldimonas manganoxidans]
MTTYIYSGPMSAATLPDGREVVLIDSQTVELPEDNAWVQTLVARGHLAPVPTAPAPKKTAQKGD